MVKDSVSWLSPLFILEDKAVKLIIIGILLILAVIVTVILYCSLIVASRADGEVINFSNPDKNNGDKRGR